MFIEIACSKCGSIAKKVDGRSRFPNLCKKCSNIAFALESSVKNPEKTKANKSKHAANNPEKVLESKRKSRVKHKVKANERTRARRIENPENFRKATRKYYVGNKDKFSEWHRKLRAEHPEKIKERYRRDYEKHPDRFAGECRKRRARKLNALGTHTTKQVLDVFDRQGGRCYDCGEVAKLTIGHKNPLSIGGCDDVINLIGQCFPCNGKQGSKVHPDATLSLFDRVTR